MGMVPRKDCQKASSGICQGGAGLLSVQRLLGRLGIITDLVVDGWARIVLVRLLDDPSHLLGLPASEK